MQFYNKWNQKRLMKSETESLRHCCLYEPELGVYLLINNKQEEEILSNEFCAEETEIYYSEEYIPVRKRYNVVSEHIRRENYKGNPTGHHLTLSLLSSERIRQVLLSKP